MLDYGDAVSPAQYSLGDIFLSAKVLTVRLIHDRWQVLALSWLREKLVCDMVWSPLNAAFASFRYHGVQQSCTIEMLFVLSLNSCSIWVLLVMQRLPIYCACIVSSLSSPVLWFVSVFPFSFPRVHRGVPAVLKVSEEGRDYPLSTAARSNRQGTTPSLLLFEKSSMIQKIRAWVGGLINCPYWSSRLYVA